METERWTTKSAGADSPIAIIDENGLPIAEVRPGSTDLAVLIARAPQIAELLQKTTAELVDVLSHNPGWLFQEDCEQLSKLCNEAKGVLAMFGQKVRK